MQLKKGTPLGGMIRNESAYWFSRQEATGSETSLSVSNKDGFKAEYVYACWKSEL